MAPMTTSTSYTPPRDWSTSGSGSRRQYRAGACHETNVPGATFRSIEWSRLHSSVSRDCHPPCSVGTHTTKGDEKMKGLRPAVLSGLTVLALGVQPVFAGERHPHGGRHQSHLYLGDVIVYGVAAGVFYGILHEMGRQGRHHHRWRRHGNHRGDHRLRHHGPVSPFVAGPRHRGHYGPRPHRPHRRW